MAGLDPSVEEVPGSSAGMPNQSQPDEFEDR